MGSAKPPNRPDPPDLENALARISQYAREHGLRPRDVCDYFSAGVVCAQIFGRDAPPPPLPGTGRQARSAGQRLRR